MRRSGGDRKQTESNPSSGISVENDASGVAADLHLSGNVSCGGAGNGLADSGNAVSGRTFDGSCHRISNYCRDFVFGLYSIYAAYKRTLFWISGIPPAVPNQRQF